MFTDNSLGFINACEELNWNHERSTPRRSDANGLADTSCTTIDRKALSSVLVQSALQENWWAEAMECHCFLRNVQDLVADGKTPHERRSNSPVEEPNIPFGAEVNIFQMSSKDQGRVHQFGTKVLSWNTHWKRLERGEGGVGLVIF